MQDLNQAIYEVCHESEKTPKEIAQEMGIGYQVFLNKANSNCDSSYFSAPQLVQIQKVAGSNLITSCMAALLRTSSQSKSIEELCIASVVENAEAVQAAFSARDRLVTGREFTKIMKEISDQRKVLDDLEDAINATNAQGQGLIKVVRAK